MRSISKLTVGLAILATLMVVDSALAYYNPRTGRFLSRDPIGEPGAMLLRTGSSAGFIQRDPIPEEPHAYAYVANRPVNSVDAFGLCPREDLLTDWKVCCGKVDKRRYGPSAGLVTHCDLRQGACSEDEVGYNVWLDGSCDRKMDNGTACCCATLDDAKDCLKRNPYSANPLGPDAGGSKCGGGEWGNNCQTSTVIQLAKCCLRSNWEPSAYAGDPRRYCARGHYEDRGLPPIIMSYTVWVCDEWVDLPEWRKTWSCVRGHSESGCWGAGAGQCYSRWVCDEWGWVNR
jgi:hypothetical protein